MPELPEVTTTVRGLQQVLPKLVFTDVWTDLAKKNQQIKQFRNTIKDETFFKKFKKEIIGQKVISVERRAKNILIYLSNDQVILIHLKMTGHLLFGKYDKKIVNKKVIWIPKGKGPLNDPYNRFIHVVFAFSNGKNLAFCDSRKFGKITMISKEKISSSLHLKNIGPEPLLKEMTFSVFEKRLSLKPKGKIKTVLMDQSVIAGIGNIYSDEMLWSSGIHPESIISKVPSSSKLLLYKAMRKVLTLGIDFGGDSMSDYRNIDGLKGNFQHHHNVYQKKGTVCSLKGCRGMITRKIVGGRGAHFCSKHQKLFK